MREKRFSIRIGLGKDLHPLAPGRPFILGGVRIPIDRGAAGHSDGDALTHAVIDALLGAAGLGDIGELFPPSDPRWKDADSLSLLEKSWALVREAGWELINLDCVISCEKPRLLPHREEIRRSLAAALGIGGEAVFLKAKTGEGLGPVGEGRAVEAEAVCLLGRAASAGEEHET
jgi:2-C-methyl-D-erythritol 2,4-cyclodiphosphate synthase